MQISDNELESITARYKVLSSKEKYLERCSKKYNSNPNEILKIIREHEKQKLKNRETRGNHYHRTSIGNFIKIVQSGALLSKKEQANAGIVNEQSRKWSSSNNVMFTFDKIRKNGNIDFGFSLEDHGAAGAEVVFIIDKSIYNKEDYDCLDMLYPTIENLNIEQYCIGLLGKTSEVVQKLKEILNQNNLEIPVLIVEEYMEKYKKQTTLEGITQIIEDEKKQRYTYNSDGTKKHLPQLMREQEQKENEVLDRIAELKQKQIANRNNPEKYQELKNKVKELEEEFDKIEKFYQDIVSTDKELQEEQHLDEERKKQIKFIENEKIESNISDVTEYEEGYSDEDIEKQQDDIGRELEGFYKNVRKKPNLYTNREVGKSTINAKTQSKEEVDNVEEENLQDMINEIENEL